VPALRPPIFPDLSKAKPVVPFDPLSLLAGAPSFQGGDAAPALSDADSGNVSAVFSAPFVVGADNQIAGAGGPGGAGGGVGALGSAGLIGLALIGGVVWIVATRR